MKHRLFTVVLALAAVMLASCIRSEDWELLKHPVHVQGQLEPNLGTPIAKGEVTINDVLHMFNGQYTGLLDPEEEVLTINFEANGGDSILAQTLMNPGTKGVFMSKDTVIHYGVNITLFDHVALQDIVNGNININHLWLTFNADIRGDCPDTVRDLVRQYVHAYFDSLVVEYVDYNHQRHTFTGVQMEPISVTNVLEHEQLSFDSVDLAEIVNSMPRRVDVSFRFRFELDNTIFNEDLAELYFNQLLDSIYLTKRFYNTHVRVAFPFEIEIGNLPYSFDVDLGEGLTQVNLDEVLDSIGGGVDIDIKESFLTLGFDNGIPLNLTIAANLIDANDIPIGPTLFTETLESAVTAPSPDDPTTEIATESTHSVVRLHADKTLLQNLRRSKKIRFSLVLATGNKHVSIRHNDYLKIKVYLQLHPSVRIDIPINDLILD